jgi:CheY-specific phosphatase CheX
MDVNYINPFLASTRNVFDKMIHVSFSLGKPYLKRPQERLHKLFQTSASIVLSGPGDGLIVFHLTRGAALALASGISGGAITAMDADCFDALGEIVSMIAGGAKKDLPGGQFSISTPKILRAYAIQYPANIPVIAIPADTGVGRFLLEVAVAPRPPALVELGAASNAPAAA